MNLALTVILALAVSALLAGCASPKDSPESTDSPLGQEFSMDQYQQNKRPLLIFAPAGNDAHLRAMRADLAEQAGAVEDRDMVLLELVPGQNRAGHQLLNEDQAAEIRRHYRIENDEFAIVLVGKDGTVKLDTRQIAGVESIFDLIDQMPMRQREMQQDD